MIHAIIDTDPGIDDAIAILYALRHPDLQIAAMTTVAGNIGLEVTTRNAGSIATLAGVETPVHAGAAAPLDRENQPELAIHGDDGLGGVVLPDPAREVESRDACAAMAAILDGAEPGSIDLFCLGPLTNLALLLERFPQSAMRLRRVIAMGGALEEPGNMASGAEFNFGHDPEALVRVLDSDLALTFIPLDATRQLRAGPDYLADLRAMGTPAAVTCADLIAAYFTSGSPDTPARESRPLHDPCVPLFAIRPELFRVTMRSVEACPHSGCLHPGPREIRVVMGLDAPALRAELRRGLAL